MKIPRKHMIIRQADLDTIVTAYVLGADLFTDVRVTPELANCGELADPEIICIECGGSGQVDLNNFDHHDPQLILPPACVQARNLLKKEDEWLRCLVEYAAAVDTCTPAKEPIQRPSLSALISGVRLVHTDQTHCFRIGLAILKFAHRENVNVYGPIPIYPDWVEYYDAAREHRAQLQQDAPSALILCADSGVRWGFLTSEHPGVHGLLRGLGCDISIAARQSPLDPGMRRISIASSGRRLDALRKKINHLEKGWGGPGHGSIIGSPFAGTRLKDAEIFGLIDELLCEKQQEV